VSEPPDVPAEGTDPADEPWPVGFVVFVVLAGLYLAVRLVQMAGWLVDRLT
jgi:hypothetical protein